MSGAGQPGRRRLAVLGHPVAPLALAGDAERRPRCPRARARAGATRRSTSRPRSSRSGCGRCPGEGFVGANVTVPHKAAALALADGASPAAREIGAANTLSFEAGAIAAENTDAPGLIASLPGPAAGSRALVLGAGGAARAVVWALLGEGAEVEVWNRTESRARRLCEAARRKAGPHPRRRRTFDLIVNSTAVGLRGEDPFAELPLRADAFHPGQVVVDLVYGDGPGALLEAAAAAGAEAVDGIEVLVRQGAASLQIWTGLEPPLELMREAARGAHRSV